MLDSEEVDFLDGSVEFELVDGSMTPRITGKLRVEELDNSCARVIIEHFDGDTLLGTEEGNAMCVEDDEAHQWNVDRSGVSNPLTDRVVVSVVKLEFDEWVRQDEDLSQVDVSNDDFVVLADGIDIGGTAWTGTEPFNDADIHWNFEDGQFTPELDALLHMDNMGGDCGRIKVKYLTDEGELIDSRASTPHCPGDNEHYDWEADVPAYSSGLIGQVEVIAQTRAGGSGTTSTRPRCRPSGDDRRHALTGHGGSRIPRRPSPSHSMRSRDEWIRTSDHRVPNAALWPGFSVLMLSCGSWCSAVVERSWRALDPRPRRWECRVAWNPIAKVELLRLPRGDSDGA